MTPADFESSGAATGIAAWFAAAVAAIGGIAMGVRKLRVGLGEDAVAIAQNGASETLVTQLHAELTRMSAQNSLLTNELYKLQSHILELTRQVTLLTGENHSLRTEISSLGAQVARMRGNPDAAEGTNL